MAQMQQTGRCCMSLWQIAGDRQARFQLNHFAAASVVVDVMKEHASNNAVLDFSMRALVLLSEESQAARQLILNAKAVAVVIVLSCARCVSQFPLKLLPPRYPTKSKTKILRILFQNPEFATRCGECKFCPRNLCFFVWANLWGVAISVETITCIP